jgi:hypothetical protein
VTENAKTHLKLGGSRPLLCMAGMSPMCMRVSYSVEVELKEKINKSCEISRPKVSAKTMSFMLNHHIDIL